MKRIITLLLAAVMLLSLFAGCAEKSEPEAPESEAPVSEAPVEEAPEAEAPAAEEAPAPEEEAPPVEEEPVVLYPVFEELHTFTIAGSASGQFLSVVDGTTFIQDNMAMNELAAATNCAIDFSMMCTDDVYSEKFNLMIAAEDYPDLICKATTTYSAGADALVEDGVCIDMLPYFDEYAPELAALFRDDKDYAEAVLSATGKAVGINHRAYPTTSGGAIIRQDWLDELGLEAPETYDELHEVLTAFKNEYGCTNTICVGAKLDTPLTYGYNITMNAETVGWSYIDGVAVCSLEIPETRQYIEMLAQYYAEGLFGDDFLSFVSPMYYDSQALNHNTGFWSSGRMTFNGQFEAKVTDDDNFALTPLKDISKTGTETSNVGGFDSVAGKNCVSVTTNCEYPEQAITFLNYMFTEEGADLANYGVKGITYDIGEDGKPYYLDLIINNPEGHNSNVTRSLYTANAFLPYMQTQEALELTFTDPRMAEAEAAWSATRSNPEYSVTLGADASSEYALIATDLNTFANEQLLSFVVGDRPVSEWDAFMEEVRAMRLDEMQAIMQAAYDEKYN